MVQNQYYFLGYVSLKQGTSDELSLRQNSVPAGHSLYRCNANCAAKNSFRPYSISGDYDLLMKLYIPDKKDIGIFINDNLLNIEGIERTYTTQTFKKF